MEIFFILIQQACSNVSVFILYYFNSVKPKKLNTEMGAIGCNIQSTVFFLWL